MKGTWVAIVVAVATIIVAAAAGWVETIGGRIASGAAMLAIIVIVLTAIVRYMWVPGEGIHLRRSGGMRDWHSQAPGHEDKSDFRP